MVELYADLAPNTCAAFMMLARQGCFDNAEIERVEPGKLIEPSCRDFNDPRCKIAIANEAKLPGAPKYEEGCIAMGGYKGMIIGGDFYFTLCYVEAYDGEYPVFGKVKSGYEELQRLGSVPVKEAGTRFIIHVPVNKEVLVSVKVDTFGEEYPDPVLEEYKI
ncbi:MAG: peptidylprolyl isomerase [Clostridia bacterium]|nr:peptidylprolyl isomerase [Clostridia bacterium]